MGECDAMNLQGWFSNKGQFLQLIVSTIACAIAGANAWSAMQKNELTSTGPILFYVLVLIVILSVFIALYRPPSSPNVNLQVTDPGNAVKAHGDGSDRYFDAVGTVT